MGTIIRTAIYRIIMIAGIAALFTMASTNVTLSADDTLWKTWRDGGLHAWQEGRLRVAEQLLIAAMEQAEKFGLDDVKVASTANDLAIVYATAGQIMEAEVYFHRALEIGERRLEPDHPIIGVATQNLGILYVRQQKYLGAETLLTRALEINVRRFGVIHPHTASAIESLSSLFAVQGKMAEAERLITTSLSILEALQVTQEDPQMRATLEVFAAILRSTNREQEVQEIEQRLEAGETMLQ